MSQKKRVVFGFDQNSEEKINFRKLRKKRPTKRLWILLIMIIMLGYLFFILRTGY